MRQSEFDKDSPLTKSGQLEEWLRTDFSRESDSKERILEHLLLKIPYQKTKESKKKGFYMRKISIQKKAARPLAAAAAIAIFIGGFSMTSFGQDLYQSVKTIFVGEHAQYFDYQQEEASGKTYAIPEELEGKLYDKDGNILEKLTDTDRIYNKDGEEVIISAMIYQDENGKEIRKVEALTKAEMAAREDSQMTTLTDPEAAKPYLAFDFSLPAYLPKGYAFDRIQLFNDENGNPVENCEYAYVYFSNGDKEKEIYLQLRLMNEETAYAGDFKDAKPVKINGHEGVMNDRQLDVEIDGVMYMFFGQNAGIHGSELLKIAESL